MGRTEFPPCVWAVPWCKLPHLCVSASSLILNSQPRMTSRTQIWKHLDQKANVSAGNPGSCLLLPVLSSQSLQSLKLARWWLSLAQADQWNFSVGYPSVDFGSTGFSHLLMYFFTPSFWKPKARPWQLTVPLERIPQTFVKTSHTSPQHSGPHDAFESLSDPCGL